MPLSQYCRPWVPWPSLQLRTVSVLLHTQFPPSGGLQLGVWVELHAKSKRASLTGS